MMHNSEYAQSDKPEIDNSAANKSSENETNGFNNNFTDTITRNSESNIECGDYSSFEDLLNIDNFIIQTENNDNDGQCNTHNKNIDTNFGVNSNVSFMQVNLALSREDATVQGDDNVPDSGPKGNITDSDKSITSSINFTGKNLSMMSVIGAVGQCVGTIDASENLINNNLNASPSSDVSLALKESDSMAQADYKIGNKGQSKGSLDSDANSVNANLPITNFEASSSLMQNLNAIERRNDIPTVLAAKSTKTSSAQRRHFPKFIKLYCEKCGESPWTTRYYSDQKCPTCENKVRLRCCKCKQESDKYENMAYHLKTKCAPNDVRYKCSQCDYDTFVRTSLKHHMKSHEPSNNIKCMDCGISVLKNKRSLENHQRYNCPNRQQERHLKCSHCCKQYRNELSFRKHRKTCFYVQKSVEEHLDKVSSHANT